jgi:hypothetical protein
MLYLGPTLFGFLLGFILGSRIKNNPESEMHFPYSSYIVVIIAALYMAWQLVYLQEKSFSAINLRNIVKNHSIKIINQTNYYGNH